MDLSTITSQFTLTNLGMIIQLAILEGLLSFDNALALAALVSGRLSDPEDRKRALLWGIWGAYIIRVGIVFVGVWLMEHEWVKFLAGTYLIWMAINELFLNKETHEESKGDALAQAEEALKKPPAGGSHQATFKRLFGVILAVELMDLMFSVDSIAVALAVSREKWVLITGAVIGILMMRVAASYFVKLIDKYPVLVPTAFVLVGIAGIKVVLEVTELQFGSKVVPMLGMHIPEYVFLPLMFAVLIGAVIYNAMHPDKFKPQA
ncbi:MAG: hypothetical protein H7249_13660 [Chitinophagaceae bacterium]|nr:hypothetical protein [Oligoflexus sp.]